MKNTRNEKRINKYLLIVCFGLAIAGAAGTGIYFGYQALLKLWLDQCVIRNRESQITISAGKMVKSDVIAEKLTLTNGANLATINFGEMRRKILKETPNLRNINISRKLPDKLIVITEEREPVARVNVVGQRGESGKVVDMDGIVFIWQRNTQTLPVIRESAKPGTQKGERLTARGLAALQVIDTCRDMEFQDFSILEVDISRPDYLLVTMGNNYARVKLAWEEMDESTVVSHKSLRRQLKHLKDAMRSHVGDGAVIWNATDFSTPGRIYADTKGKL